jgi:hypothetical protein
LLCSCGHQPGTAIDDRRRSVKSCSTDRMCSAARASRLRSRGASLSTGAGRDAGPLRRFLSDATRPSFCAEQSIRVRRPFSDEKCRRHLHFEEQLIEAVSAKPLEPKSEQRLGANRART